jgi:hypothetical protein
MYHRTLVCRKDGTTLISSFNQSQDRTAIEFAEGYMIGSKMSKILKLQKLSGRQACDGTTALKEEVPVFKIQVF